MLFAVMLTSTKNNSPALPADTGEAATTGRRKSMCTGVQKPMEEKRSLEKLNCMKLYNVPPTLERKYYREPFSSLFQETASISQYQCMNTSI